ESSEKAVRALAKLAWWQERKPKPDIPLPPRWGRLGEGTSGRLPFMQACELLQAFGIPVIPTRLCHSQEDAVKAAEELGYPVAVKADVAHKSDVDAVRLGCTSPQAVRDAFVSMGKQDVLVQAMAAP